LLKLKEIELLGFKSFADRTRLICDGSTAAIVGPNGCGKSNLSDAVSWVLGEQSARILRGERMSDVIFSGTGTRPPTGMAEVSITLVEGEETAGNGAEELERVIGVREPSEPGEPQQVAEPETQNEKTSPRIQRFPGSEIKVTRRLFRSGESEYLLNGELCRLRDIQDLFMGTGLGPESYAIIEQGRIGQILSSKPSDRRAIIEEAAGVSKFKSRKRLAEAKLESSRQNLARINDILEEISKQVNSLKRQATKAGKYRELQKELLARQKRMFASRLLLLEGECAKLREGFAAIREECLAAAQELERLESERSQAASRHEQLEEEVRKLREGLAQGELEAERLRSGLEKARQQSSILETRVMEARQEQAQLEQQAQALNEEAQAAAERARQIRAEWTSAQEALASLTSSQSRITEELAAAEAAMEAGRQQMLRAVSRVAELRNEMVKAEEMQSSTLRQLARVEAERQAADADYQHITAEIEAVQAEHQSSEAALTELTQGVTRTKEAVEKARHQESIAREEVENLSRSLSQASARKQALEESLARHAYSTESVRRLLSASKETDGFQPLGVLADFLEVTPGYEEAVEEFLKTELDCVVVEQPDEARSGIALLKNEKSGRSGFFVRSFSSNNPSHEMLHGEAQDARRQAGVVASLQELVRFEPRLGLNGDLAFPALANSFVVEDAAAAEHLAAAYPTCHFITRSGEHYHHRLVSGGRISNAGPLALRRDFRELERRTSDLGRALQDAETRWTTAREQLRQSEEELQRLSAERLGAEKQSMLTHERLRHARETERQALDRIQVTQREMAALAEEQEKAERRSMALKGELARASEEQQAREKDCVLSADRVRQLRGELDRMNQALTEAQVKSSAFEERWRAADADSNRILAEARHARERLAHLETQSKAWEEERQRLHLQAEEIENALAAAETRQQTLREQLQAQEAESLEARTRRDELSPQVDAARSELEARRERRSEAEVALARAESDLNHHVHQCREELGTEPDTLRAEAAPEDLLQGDQMQAAEEELREIKGRIERLGPVNMMALEELQESEERLNFLETQRQDLLASIQDTTQTIREIDEASRRKFMEAFNAINRFFAESFRTLFGGGVGEMRFSDESDPESGIDLVAQPPGKRLQNVLLLSGGEKALTALALLIAVFRFTPSPFCILDEVDAPLDESNVVRFTRMIQEMSEQTQFILITHNKRTMEICRTLYGVTMEEPGVSKLVSVRFEAGEREPVAVTA
jgi:chromosome segregation protein